VAVVGRRTKIGRIYKKIQKEKQYTKQHKAIQEYRINKIENKNTKQENKHQKNIKKHNSGNFKITKRSK